MTRGIVETTLLAMCFIYALLLRLISIWIIHILSKCLSSVNGAPVPSNWLVDVPISSYRKTDDVDTFTIGAKLSVA